MISSCWIAWQERIANVVSAIENATLVRQLECNKWNFPVGLGSRFSGMNKFYIWGLLIGTALMLWITWNLESSSRGLGTVVNQNMHGLYGLYQCSCMRKWNSCMAAHDVTQHRMFCMYCMWQGFFSIHFDLFGTQASFVPAGRLGDTQIWNSGSNGGLSVSSWASRIAISSWDVKKLSRSAGYEMWLIPRNMRLKITDLSRKLCRLFLWCSMGLFSKGRRVQTKQVIWWLRALAVLKTTSIAVGSGGILLWTSRKLLWWRVCRMCTFSYPFLQMVALHEE